MVLAKKHLARQPLDPALKPQGRDWVAMGLMIRGFRVLQIALYLSDDNTPTSISMGNLGKLHEIFCFLKRSGCPFIIGADWNMVSKVLLELSWLDDIGGDVVEANGLDFTCTMGSGRIIDYFVASRNSFHSSRTLGGTHGQLGSLT